jgi:hypothetical protein
MFVNEDFGRPACRSVTATRWRGYGGDGLPELVSPCSTMVTSFMLFCVSRRWLQEQINNQKTKWVKVNMGIVIWGPHQNTPKVYNIEPGSKNVLIGFDKNRSVFGIKFKCQILGKTERYFWFIRRFFWFIDRFWPIFYLTFKFWMKNSKLVGFLVFVFFKKIPNFQKNEEETFHPRRKS